MAGPDKSRFNHNHFAAVFVVLAGLFLYRLTVGSDVPLAELTGVAIHRLAVFFCFVCAFIISIGGTRYDVVEEMKANLVALAFLIGSIVIGAALVIAH